MHAPSTANDRFKQSSRSSFWIALTLATLAHAAVFIASPVFALAEREDAADPVVRLIDVPEVAQPEPPEPVRRPAEPVISDVVPTDVTLAPFTPEDWDARPLTPPEPGRKGMNEAFVFTPMDVAPRLLNPAEVQRVLQREYPPVLRDAGIGGVVAVWFHIDERGRVVDTRIHRPSGYEELDRAALAVAGGMEFAPALTRDQRVPVWVSIEIRFEVQ